MKFKIFFVFILTFMFVPIVCFAETYTFTDREDIGNREWQHLYNRICSSSAQNGIDSAQGCKYYWDDSITTSGFSDNRMAYNGHGCPNDSNQAAANYDPNPTTCLTGTIDKFELLGFSDINDVVRLLQNNTCNNESCFNYVKDIYCDNWNNSESICTVLKVFDSNASSGANGGTNNVIGDEIDITSCEQLLGSDTPEGQELIKLIKMIVRIVFTLIPIIVIVLTIVDFSKAIFAGEEDMKKAQAKFIKRILIAIAIFLIPTILRIILEIANLIWPNISNDLCGIL